MIKVINQVDMTKNSTKIIKGKGYGLMTVIQCIPHLHKALATAPALTEKLITNKVIPFLFWYKQLVIWGKTS